jgi:hypothetical protein
MAHALHERSWDGFREDSMGAVQRTKILLGAALAFAGLLAANASWAQEGTTLPAQQNEERPILSQDRIGASNNAASVPLAPGVEQNRKAADGQRHGLPVETYGIAPGTKFLVALDDNLGTKDTPDRMSFRVKTLEPLEAGSGIYLPSGAEIHGHIGHVEGAGMTGRAKLWLTFDEIQTKFGRLPIVADVVAVPGDHTVRCPAKEEGLIETRTSTQQDAAQAAAEAAALGAMKGVKDKNAKEAAAAAALAALAAYIAESGRGHELQLAKGTKLELELERPLYLVKE